MSHPRVGGDPERTWKKMKKDQFFVYILANKKNGTLYVGSTSNIFKRIYEHKNEVMEGFSKKYGTKKLVYFEETHSAYGAITRERQLKKWNRAWKIRLIEEQNPGWEDISLKLMRFGY